MSRQVSMKFFEESQDFGLKNNNHSDKSQKIINSVPSVLKGISTDKIRNNSSAKKNSMRYKQKNNQKIKKIFFKISHRSQNLIDHDKSDAETHQWTVNVVPLANYKTDFDNVVDCVIFKLHSSFANPIRQINQNPFTITEKGWGSFDLKIDIRLKDSSKQTFKYDLILNSPDVNFHEKSHNYILKVNHDLLYSLNKDSFHDSTEDIDEKIKKKVPVPMKSNNKPNSFKNQNLNQIKNSNKNIKNLEKFNSIFGETLVNGANLEKKEKILKNLSLNPIDNKPHDSSHISDQNHHNKISPLSPNILSLSSPDVDNNTKIVSSNNDLDILEPDNNNNNVMDNNEICAGPSSVSPFSSSPPQRAIFVPSSCGQNININSLQNIQLQIMGNNNCQKLKTIVECVDHSGNLQKTNTGYSFDLYALDSDTIMKIQRILGT